MIIQRLYDEGLAQAGYLVACDTTRRAVVVDPDRDIERYLDAAEREDLDIVFVTETHIHADFVSGARELARRAGATLVLSGHGDEEWRYRYGEAEGARLLRHGEWFEVGRVHVGVRHTPGHTPEHICFVVTDRAASDRPIGMLSGDFIFVGDVGRPDLLERAANVAGTTDPLARQLFHSLRAMSDLPDYLQIWPGHGAGSACGKALGAMPSTTLGYERLVNWAFQIDDEERFVREVVAGQPEPPRYFARMKTINRDGPPPRPTGRLAEVDLAGVRRAIDAGTPVVDVRRSAAFAEGHIPRTLNIPVGNSFPTWAGSLLPYDRDIVLLADDHDRITQARGMLSLVGIDRVAGFARGDVLSAWRDRVSPLARVDQIDPAAVETGNHHRILDVRSRAEWDAGHLPKAEHRFLGDLVELTRDLPRDTPLAVHCHSGTRASIAASLLQAQGFTDVANMAGGFAAWEEAGLPVER
jgi:hydroxyacylglutathione hydrolase